MESYGARPGLLGSRLEGHPQRRLPNGLTLPAVFLQPAGAPRWIEQTRAWYRSGRNLRNVMKRARDLGIPFDGVPGPWNAITDVPGVEVGYATLVAGDGPFTGGRRPRANGRQCDLPAAGPATTRSLLPGFL